MIDRIGLNENQASSKTRLSTDQISELSDITVKGDYELKNGMLYFKSAKTFFATDSILRKLDRNQRIKFTENLGLSSILGIKSKVFHELANEDSTDNYSKTILDNKDILKQEGDQLTSVFGTTFEHLVNREGMVSIGGKVHCFGNDRVVIASTVQDARDSYIAGKKLKEDIVYLSKNSAKGAKVSAGPCSSIFRQAYNNENTRRVDLYITLDYSAVATGTSGSTTYYTLIWNSHVLGRAFKKNVFGGWPYYETNNHLTGNYKAHVGISQGGLIIYDGSTEISTSTLSNYSTEINFDGRVYTIYDVPNTGYYNLYTYSYGDFYVTESDITIGKYYTDGVPNGVEFRCP